MKKLSAFVITALFSTGLYAAGDPQSAISFDDLDANGDNRVSKTELKILGDLAGKLNQYDQNNDQRLDRSEFAGFETEIQQQKGPVENGNLYGTW